MPEGVQRAVHHAVTRDEALARTDLAALLENIGAARGLHSQRDRHYPCPDAAHEQTGNSPPASISPDRVTWYCHSCETGGTAVDALILSGRARDAGDALGQLGVDREEPQTPPERAREVEAYTYTDEDGAPLFQVVRMEPKTFRQRRWTGTGYQWGLGDTRKVLYHLPEVLAACRAGKWIFVTEGEKDANAVRSAGQCGTTMPMGAGKWESDYTEALTGANVIVMADDDETGRKHAARVYRELYGKANRVAIRLPADGQKDIADHLAAGLSLNGDLRKDDSIAQLSAPASKGALTAALFASRKSSDKALEVLGPLFQRGMRTAIGAQTGEGKTTFSLLAIQALTEGEPFLDWQPRGKGRALIVDLEQGEETIKARLADTGLDSSDRVEILWEPSGIALDKREEDRAMVYDVLREGHYDLVLLDPLYQLHQGSGNDETVAAETMRVVDGWAREFNAAFVIPMHARKPHPEAGRNFTIHDIAGVGTWLRNAEFVMGLQLIAPRLSRLWFFKDRIGRGPEIRSSWWMDFDRAEGFKRNHKEDHDRIKKHLKQMLQSDDGASRAELAAVEGSNDVFAQQVIQTHGKHRQGDRYRTRKWPEATVSEGQTAMDTGT